LKLRFERKRGKSERCRRSSAGWERVQALAGEKRANMLGESDREGKLVFVTRNEKHGNHSHTIWRRLKKHAFKGLQALKAPETKGQARKQIAAPCPPAIVKMYVIWY
jgi:hypothetical protein